MRFIFPFRPARTNCLAALALLAAVLPTRAEDWKTFISKDGYTINYPATGWYPRQFIPPESTDLWIQTTRKNSVHNYVDNGQASIWVYRAARGTDLSQWRDSTAGMYDERELKREELPAAAVAPGCDRVIEVSRWWKTVTPDEIRDGLRPSPPAQDTNFYCQSHNDIYAIRVSYWPGDKRQSGYEATALAMLKTFRAQP